MDKGGEKAERGNPATHRVFLPCIISENCVIFSNPSIFALPFGCGDPSGNSLCLVSEN